MNKLLIVAPLPPPVTGLSQAVKQFVDNASGYEFEILIINTASDFEEIKSQGEIQFRKIKNAIVILGKMIRIILSNRADALYLTIAQSRFGLMRDAMFIHLCSIMGLSVIIHLHGGRYYREQYDNLFFGAKSIVKRALKKVNAAIVLSDNLRSVFAGLVQNDKIHVVENGESDMFFDGLPKETESADKPLNILYLSNLIPEKGIFDFLEALGLYFERSGEFNAVVAGPWIEKNDELIAKEILIRYGIMDKVSFVGYVNDAAKKDLLAWAEIFIFPTYYSREGQPKVILESMMAGLPIISTPRGSIPEIIKDGENGYIVNERDPLSISEKLIMLQGDRKLLSSMGNSARAEYLRNYREKHYIDKLHQVILNGFAHN